MGSTLEAVDYEGSSRSDGRRQIPGTLLEVLEFLLNPSRSLLGLLLLFLGWLHLHFLRCARLKLSTALVVYNTYALLTSIFLYLERQKIVRQVALPSPDYVIRMSSELIHSLVIVQRQLSRTIIDCDVLILAFLASLGYNERECALIHHIRGTDGSCGRFECTATAAFFVTLCYST